jgi:regulatory protein YycH of two-component signal transduction system YycFG
MLTKIVLISFIIIIFILIINRQYNNHKDNIKAEIKKVNNIKPIEKSSTCDKDFSKLFGKINVCEDKNNLHYYCIPNNNKIELKCKDCSKKIKNCTNISKNHSTYYDANTYPLGLLDDDRCCKDNDGYHTGQICEIGKKATHYSSIYKYCPCE